MHRIRTMLRAAATDSPDGSGSAPGQPAAAAGQPAAAAGQTALPLQSAEKPEAEKPAAPKIDPADPELRKLIAAAAKDAATKAAADERAKIEEEARLAKLDAESRAKAEKTKAEAEATAAKAEAEKAKSEAAFTRGLLGAGLVPQTELAESMALAAAKELVGQGVPWADAVAKVGKDHSYLFKPQAAPGGTAAGTQGQSAQPSTPSTVQDARTLNTGASQPTSGGGGQVVTNAFDMSPEQWAKAQQQLRQGKSPARA